MNFLAQMDVQVLNVNALLMQVRGENTFALLDIQLNYSPQN